MLNETPQVARIIISVAVMLFLGFAMTRLTKLLKLPNVTAYILTGILIGPFCLNLIPQQVIEGMDFLSDIALAFIAFSTGEFFRISTLKKNLSKVLIITLFESLLASVFIFILTFFLLKLSFVFSLVLSALAAATAPASTMMTIRQTGAKGDFVDTLLQVVALDDIVGLVAYSMAISISLSSLSSKTFNFMSVVKPLLVNLFVLVLGAIFGVLLKILMPKKRSTDNRLIIGIAVLFAFCGVCAILDVSPLLGCMSMGTVYINISEDDKFFRQMGYFSPPILLLFFVRSGLCFDLSALTSTSASIGNTPLIMIGILYFIVRIAGKYSGAFLGSFLAKKPALVRNNLGLALIPQAGVAIGLASLGARTIGGETGNALLTIILASSVLYELVGPGCAKLSLYLSKSYSNNLEDITAIPESEEPPKNRVEELIQRIRQIQSTMPEPEEMSEEERAFTEASMEQYLAHNTRRYKKNLWRK